MGSFASLADLDMKAVLAKPATIAANAPRHDPHRVLALQHSVGNQAVLRMLARQGSEHWTLVQRAPAAASPQNAAAVTPAKGASTSVASASDRVQNAYHLMFNNQRSGLTRLGAALNKEKPESSLVAALAAAAVGVALGALLGPVGEAAGEMVAETSKALVLKVADKIKDFAIEKAKDKVKEYMNEPKKSDPKDNFIEAQSIALNWAEAQTIDAFLKEVDGIAALPNGFAALDAMTQAIFAASKTAAGMQISAAAGQWASIIKEPGDNSKAWANDDNETHNEKGAIEIRIRVDRPHLENENQIKIVSSNWVGINRETERVVQEHEGATIGDLGANLRITVETPVGETGFEYEAHNATPIIPVQSMRQGVMIWLQTGENNPSTDNDGGVTSMAAFTGILVKRKSVTELHFGE